MGSPRETEESKLGLGAKLGVAALALLGAVFFFSRGNSEWEQPDTAESAVPYVCWDDGHVVSLTPAGLERMWKSGDIQDQAQERAAGTLVLRCPECQKFSSVRGYACPNDETIVPIQDQNGRPAYCPKCRWSFADR